ncbi:MAG: hypothetical protein HC854_14995 [Flavobacterium sp.]|nr:hypothetical protein [Flavobacterium sp.]
MIEKYNYILRGIINFYSPEIGYVSQLNKYLYLLTYSCAHTIAAKHNMSLRKVFKKYGNPISAIKTQANAYEIKQTKQTLINWEKMKEFYQLRRRMGVNDAEEDYIKIHSNHRTSYKLNKFCVICYDENNLEMHHTNHVRKMGIKKKGFSRIMSSINRKQVVVCRNCHRKIHLGQ